VIWENGVPGFQIPTDPYSWLGPNPTDMMLFSLRRESPLATGGTLDPLGSGLTIEPGDILVPLAGRPPGIFVPAESLGLATRRNDPAIPSGDDLDALDVLLAETVIPEPASLSLLGLGLALWAAHRMYPARNGGHVARTTQLQS